MALDVHGPLEALWRAPLGIGVLDEDLRFLRVNEAFARFDGVPAAVHQGKTLLEVLPEQAPALGDELRRVRRGATAIDLEISRGAAHAGEPPRTWRLSLVPLGSGDAGGVGVLVVDVTDARRGAAPPASAGRHERTGGTPLPLSLSKGERIRAGSDREIPDSLDTSAERSPEARLRRYELLARMTGEIVLFVRRSDGRIVDANAAAEAAYGYAREELLARTIHDLRLPGAAPLTHQQMAQADASGIVFETVHRRRDGSTFPVEVSSVGSSVDGERMLLSLVRDVSAWRRLEEALRAREDELRAANARLTALNEQLREADRRKDEFLGMLSHELRNPLAPIRNSLHILGHGALDEPRVRRAVQVIDRQSRHLTRLVDDLLDVTRIARGKIQLRRGRLDLGLLAQRTAEDNRELLRTRGIELAVDTPATPVPVDGDETRLAQVLGNLLHNAAKFTPAGGRVTVSVSLEHPRAVLRVRDTGAGIDPAFLATIFEPFTQGAQTLARSEGGLGLGLALVQGLVGLHGGEVRAASGGPGRGTELTVTLPLLAAEPARAVPVARPPAPPARRRVLVVDDNHDAAESLAQLLQVLGHEAEVAYEGPSALEKARATRPDAVLCDLGLPGMDGYAVARELRSAGLEEVRLVAVSGYAQPEDVARAVAAGFDAHLAKPADPARLQELLE